MGNNRVLLKKLIIGTLLFISSIEFATAQLNYALTKPVTIVPLESNTNTSKITDGFVNSTNYWKSSNKWLDRSVSIDLNANFPIRGAHIYFFTQNSFAPKEFEFQYLKDGEWSSFEGGAVENNYSNNIRLVFDQSQNTSQIRVVFINSSNVIISEIALWGLDVPEIGEGVELKLPEPFLPENHWIGVNQVAYNLKAPKGFTVPTAQSELSFSILEKETGKVVFKGQLKNKKGDFTDFNPPNMTTMPHQERMWP